jgi:hypothetical protein
VERIRQSVAHERPLRGVKPEIEISREPDGLLDEPVEVDLRQPGVVILEIGGVNTGMPQKHAPHHTSGHRGVEGQPGLRHRHGRA